MSDKNYVKLNIYFARVNPSDNEGIVEISSRGYPDNFAYSSAGDMHRFQKDTISTEPEMLALCDEIKILMQKYFPIGEMPCLNDFDESES